MQTNQFALLTKRRFLPLFITQFLNAFNDNFFKSALVVLIYTLVSDQAVLSPKILVVIAGGLLIFPTILFSAPAGALADKFEKAALIRIIKFSEVLLMLIGTLGFLYQNVTVLMIVLGLLGVQATFFGPLKYSILPTHLKDDELVAGNGLIESGTFLAVLLGTILGAVAIAMPTGLTIISFTVVGVAVLGFLSAWFVPKALPPAPNLKLSLNIVKESWEVYKFTKKSPSVFLCVIGISWFWTLGLVFLMELKEFSTILGGNNDVYVLFISLFSVGIAIGSGFCNRLLKGQIEATYVPLGALGMSLFIFDLFFASDPIGATSAAMPLREFLLYPSSWRIMVDLLFIAFSGGIFIVPLYAIMQHRAEDSHKARVIAGNNIVNSVYMSIAAGVTAGLLALGLTIPQVFLLVGVINLGAVMQTTRLLPGALVRSILRLILHFLYRVEVKGLENFEKAGSRAVIAPNHTSFLDAVLLAAYLPSKKVSFAMYSAYAERWWAQPIKMFVDIFPVQPTNPYSIKAMIQYVRRNRKLVIFPEGRVTVTGALMKVYEGPGFVADKADAVILPVLIDGAQYTPFSRLKGLVRLRLFPKITITVFEPTKLVAPQNMSARKRRQALGDQLYHIMSNIMFLGTRIDTTLFQSLLDARKVHGRSHKVLEDIQRVPLSYQRLIMASLVVGKKLAKLTFKGEAVGVLLPNVNANAVTFFGLQAHLRVAALINFSAGIQNVLMAVKTSQIKLICTSRTFIETARMQAMIQALEQSGARIIYLEDLRAEISIVDKLHAFVAANWPRLFAPTQKTEFANDPAVILFTSGSEGTPKAVVLSHRNLHANKAQLSSRVDFTPADIVLNALPMFHSFGLTAGTILPILHGLKVFFYPSPLHYRVIPELCYDINATILFGTNTFLSGYARFAHPYDFYSLRYAYAGAEKLKEETRRLWADKFGVRVFEGYGATETAPVISANTPMHNKPGTVGKFMPGIEHHLSVLPDIEEGGRLSVKGPNVMLGYMLHDNPGKLVPCQDGWYDTGDIVSVDDEGYITILGRAKRFAKIGGEMISLAFVEQYIDKLWPSAVHAVVSIPDEKKGEQLLLVTTQPNPDKSAIMQYAKANGISELAVPRVIHAFEKLPLLGSGKVDYAGINELLSSARRL